MDDQMGAYLRAMRALGYLASMAYRAWLFSDKADTGDILHAAGLRPKAIKAPFYLATMTAEDTEYYWHCWRCHENGYFVGQDNADALSHVSRSGHSVRVLITRSFTYKAVNT